MNSSGICNSSILFVCGRCVPGRSVGVGVIVGVDVIVGVFVTVGVNVEVLLGVRVGLTAPPIALVAYLGNTIEMNSAPIEKRIMVYIL
jgi:hypothetical protein